MEQTLEGYYENVQLPETWAFKTQHLQPHWKHSVREWLFSFENSVRTPSLKAVYRSQFSAWNQLWKVIMKKCSFQKHGHSKHSISNHIGNILSENGCSRLRIPWERHPWNQSTEANLACWTNFGRLLWKSAASRNMGIQNTASPTTLETFCQRMVVLVGSISGTNISLKSVYSNKFLLAEATLKGIHKKVSIQIYGSI